MKRGGSESARGLELAGLAAAVVVGVIMNVLAARHFTRWDWTENRRWSISPATAETLASLDRPIDVWAVVGRGDPIEAGLRQLLVAYTTASNRIDVRWVDPDRDAVRLVDLQRRFGLDAGGADGARSAMDALVIVATGDRHWFLNREDLSEASDDVHVRPKEERALTQAIRNVLGGDKSRLCFTVGHGELTLDPQKDERESLGDLRGLLEKSNYELASVDMAEARESLAGCTVVIVAGPREAFSHAESTRLRGWLLEGGSVFAAVGPSDALESGAQQPSGIDDVLAPFGIALDDDVVHDSDPALAIPDTHGEGFFVTALPHPVTAGLVVGGAVGRPPRVTEFFVRSLRHLSAPDAVSASDLLSTSESAYAKANMAGAAEWTGVPPREPGDRGGPFVVAMAAERPRANPAARRRSRVVVVGTRFALAEDNWRQPRAMHGAAFFVDGALSWLAMHPAVIDVPDRADVAVAVRLSEEGRAEVRRYVIVWMPLASLLLGLAVWAWRRSSEDGAYVPHVSRKDRGDDCGDDSKREGGGP